MRLLYGFVFLISLQIAACNIIQLRRNILHKVLSGYDSNLRPFTTENSDIPTKISINLFLVDLFEVNDVKMEYAMQLYLRQIWDDHRLRYPDPEGIVQSVSLTETSKIWTPDLFFGERDGKFHNIQRPNKQARIFPTGKVFLNSRLTLKMRCPMNFKYFPFDRQLCAFELESYGLETRDLALKWSDGNPIQVNSALHMTTFVLEDYTSDFCDKPTKYGNGCLRVKLQLKRCYGYYLTQLFVPFVILVAVSWLSLWLDAKAVVLRLPIILVLLFFMIQIHNELQNTMPRTSYSKAVDIWTAVCIALVFTTLLQFVLVHQLSRREKRASELHLAKNGGCGGRDCQQQTQKMRLFLEQYAHHAIPLSKKIDFVSRVLFPVAFVIFNCIFWFTYIKGRDSRLSIK